MQYSLSLSLSLSLSKDSPESLNFPKKIFFKTQPAVDTLYRPATQGAGCQCIDRGRSDHHRGLVEREGQVAPWSEVRSTIVS